MVKTERIGGILVKCGNEVLLCKRGLKGSLPGVWSIPSGHIHPNETAKIGAIREFNEETDLKIGDNIDLVGMFTVKEDEHSLVFFVFFYESKTKVKPDLVNAKDGHEHTECGFFDKNSLPMDESNKLYKIVMKILE